MFGNSLAETALKLLLNLTMANYVRLKEGQHEYSQFSFVFLLIPVNTPVFTTCSDIITFIRSVS